MLRRLVASRLSSPIYADEKSSLMPSLLGAPYHRYRLFVIVLCLFFLYIWHGREQKYSEELRRRDERVEMLQKEHDSVAEKLRVIWLHKKKIETELKAKNAESDKILSRIKLKESEIFGWKTKNEQCQDDLSNCRISSDHHDSKKHEDSDNSIELNKRIQKLEAKLKENEKNKNVMTEVLQDELKQCESKIKQLTGGGAIEHYSQNETAHFSRNHKADEPLSFDRGNIQHHIPNKLLLGRQLAETLEEAKVKKLEDKEQLNKHPQDREEKDQEVNEQPDRDEQDYKEH